MAAVGEVLIVVVLGALGVLAYRDTMGCRRWDAPFWRTGIVLFRRAVPVDVRPADLPEPQIPPSWFGWRAKVHRLAALEVAFTAQCSNAPIMKGLLSFDDAERAIVVTGRVFWGVLPLFVSMACITLFFEPRAGAWLGLALAGLVVVDYWYERRRFADALAWVVSELSRRRA